MAVTVASKKEAVDQLGAEGSRTPPSHPLTGPLTGPFLPVTSGLIPLPVCGLWCWAFVLEPTMLVTFPHCGALSSAQDFLDHLVHPPVV